MGVVGTLPSLFRSSRLPRGRTESEEGPREPRYLASRCKHTTGETSLPPPLPPLLMACPPVAVAVALPDTEVGVGDVPVDGFALRSCSRT